MTSTLAGLASSAANAAWRDSGWASEQLLRHVGKTLRVEVRPAPASASFTMRVADDGTWQSSDAAIAAETSDSSARPDATLRITPSVAVKLAALPDKPGALLDLTGDPSFVSTLRDLHDVLPIAIEDRLSGVAGPIFAHALSSMMRSIAQWPKAAAERVNAGAAAYFTEETAVLVHRDAFNRFAMEVEALAHRAERVISQNRL